MNQAQIDIKVVCDCPHCYRHVDISYELLTIHENDVNSLINMAKYKRIFEVECPECFESFNVQLNW